MGFPAARFTTNKARSSVFSAVMIGPKDLRSSVPASERRSFSKNMLPVLSGNLSRIRPHYFHFTLDSRRGQARAPDPRLLPPDPSRIIHSLLGSRMRCPVGFRPLFLLGDR